MRPLDYNSNSTYQRYSGYDVLNVSPSDVLTSAEYQWRQIAINVVASGLEMRINKGDSRIIALVKSRIKNAIRTFKNNFSVDLYLVTGRFLNQIGGLQLIVADSGAGTVGGIDAGAWPFWQNKVQSAAAPMQRRRRDRAFGNDDRRPHALPLYLEQTRGDDQPDLVVSSNDFYHVLRAVANEHEAVQRHAVGEGWLRGVAQLQKGGRHFRREQRYPTLAYVLPQHGLSGSRRA